MLWKRLRKAAPDRDPADAPQQPEVFYLSSGIGVALVKWNDHIAANAAMKHPIVYRALNKIAESVQQVRWYAELDENATREDRQSKATFIRELQGLLDNPHEELTAEMLRYWMALNYACYGRVPLRIGTSAIANKAATGLYPLEARYTRVKLDKTGIAYEYQYGEGEEKQLFPSRTKYAKSPTSRGFVDQIWKPALRGYQHKDEHNSPLGAIGLPAQVIRSLLYRAIQTAEGHPNVRYLVTCSRTLTESQLKTLKKYLNQDHGVEGPDGGRIPILQNAADITIHKLENDLSDIHSKMPSDDMARLIFGAFGIPIALAGMGAADGAKFAGNYIESRQAFWQDTIIPGYDTPLRRGLTRMLCPAGVTIKADYDSIPALVAGRISAMKEASELSFLTTNEKREMFGWEATSDIPATAGDGQSTGENDA